MFRRRYVEWNLVFNSDKSQFANSINVQYIFQNDNILDSLNRVPWYLLPHNRKMEYLHLLIRLQSGKELKIGPFGVLNYEMATDVRLLLQFNW